MKKAISLFLALVMMISMSVSAFAAESSEEYYTIQVEYSDNTGHQESLDIMIQNDNVFVDAEMLAERLGYTFGENGESAVISIKIHRTTFHLVSRNLSITALRYLICCSIT